MDERERFHRLLFALRELEEENASCPIIVEGRKDVESLVGLGLHGTILPINNGIPLLDFCETITADHPRVILLLDWDRKGEGLMVRLRRTLAHLGAQVDTRHRDAIRRWVNAQLKDIESLYPYVSRGRRKFGEPRGGPLI